MKEMEIKTVYQKAQDYIKSYRDVDQFLAYCKACPRYNRCWACPEFDFDVRTLVDSYEHVYLIGAKVPIGEDLRNSVTGAKDVGTMAEQITKDARKKLDPIMLSLEKSMGDALCCYGGTCYLCETCQKEEGKPCVHPKERRSSLEAIGFDVAATTEELLGFALLWSQDKLPPYITVISALFTNSLLDQALVHNI